MTNLEELWRQIEESPDSLFHWGRSMCSGFLVMNLPRIEDIWGIARKAPIKDIAKERKQNYMDQVIYMAVNITQPNEVHVLEEGWDMTVTERWQSNHQPYGEKYPNVGMATFLLQDASRFFIFNILV